MNLIHRLTLSPMHFLHLLRFLPLMLCLLSSLLHLLDWSSIGLGQSNHQTLIRYLLQKNPSAVNLFQSPSGWVLRFRYTLFQVDRPSWSPQEVLNLDPWLATVHVSDPFEYLRLRLPLNIHYLVKGKQVPGLCRQIQGRCLRTRQVSNHHLHFLLVPLRKYIIGHLLCFSKKHCLLSNWDYHLQIALLLIAQVIKSS